MAGIPRTLPEIIRKAISGALSDVHVALPGKVVSWDPTKNLADIQVMVQHAVFDDDNGRTYEDIGTLAGVPVMWPRAGGFVMTLPMTAGDTGLLVFCSSGIGEWRSSNQSSQPADASRHDIGWPVFIPGLFADVKPFTGSSDPRSAKAIFGADGGNGQIRASASALEFGPNPVSAIALATPVDANLAQVVAQVNVFVVAFNALVTLFTSHVHDKTTPAGVGNFSGTPSAAGVPAVPLTACASVASALCKSL